MKSRSIGTTSQVCAFAATLTSLSTIYCTVARLTLGVVTTPGDTAQLHHVMGSWTPYCFPVVCGCFCRSFRSLLRLVVLRWGTLISTPGTQNRFKQVEPANLRCSSKGTHLAFSINRCPPKHWTYHSAAGKRQSCLQRTVSECSLIISLMCACMFLRVLKALLPLLSCPGPFACTVTKDDWQVRTKCLQMFCMCIQGFREQNRIAHAMDCFVTSLHRMPGLRCMVAPRALMCV